MANNLDSSTIQAISTAVAGVLSPILQPRQQLNTVNVVGSSNSNSITGNIESGSGTAARSVNS